MTGAAGAVRTVEVTRATRSVTIGELEVGEGDLLGLLDDKVVAAARPSPSSRRPGPSTWPARARRS